MNCKTAQNLLSAYIDGELSGGEMSRIRTHLFECDCCQHEETELRLLKDLLVGTPMIEPPQGFEDRLCEAIFSPKPSETAAWIGSWPFVSGVALVTAALTLLIVTRLGAGEQQVAQRPDSVVVHEKWRDQTQDASDPFMNSNTVMTANYDGK